MSDLISDERVGKAIDYLVATDGEAARAKTLVSTLDKNEKTVLAIEFLKAEGTVQAKDATARTSEEYKKWLKSYDDAVYDYELFRNRRNTAELIIEMWRSCNANKRKGNI